MSLDVRRLPYAEYPDIDPSVRAVDPREGQVQAMKKYERRQFFERLVQLRALYRLRGPDDSVSVMPIDEAIGYSEHLLGDTVALAAVLGPDVSGRTGSTTPESRAT
jgi:hypothetical protein